MNQEIKAVAAGLQSLERQDRDESYKDAELEEEEDEEEHEKQEDENLHGVEGFHLQRVLAGERLASLQKKRIRLLQKLATMQAGLLDAHEEDEENDSDADIANAKAKARKGKSVMFADHKLDGEDSDELDDPLESTSGFVETVMCASFSLFS